MPLISLTLSGYKSSNPKGCISVQKDRLTIEAAARTSCGKLCWCDVQFLDDAFRKSMPGVPNGLEYMRNVIYCPGKHLFAILTGLKVSKFLDAATGCKIESETSTAVKITGGQSFPGAFGYNSPGSYSVLFALMLDSAYGSLLNRWKEIVTSLDQSTVGLATSLPIPTPHQPVIDRMFLILRGIVNGDNSLCLCDKMDLYAECALHYWATHSIPFDVSNLNGTYTQRFPACIQNLPLHFTRPGNQVALNFARTSPLFPGFPVGFGISPGYGQNAFPRRPG